MFDGTSSIIAPEAIILLALGLAFGSFGNVLIARLPKRQAITGRSQCPSCGQTLGPLELLPVLSFVLLQGRCRACKKSISLQYPVVEIIAGALFLIAGLLTQWNMLQATLLGLALWLLFVIAIIDARTQRISDALNVPLLGIAIAFSIVSHSFDPYALVIGVGFLGLQWAISRGAWVGTGDVILIISISLLVGTWSQMMFSLFSSYIFGGAVAAALLASKKRKRTDALAFAPFLALGLLISLLVGEQILWKLYGI